MNTEINRDAHKLQFKGEEFRLGQLLSLAKAAPPIEVKLDDLNLLGITKQAMAKEEQRYIAVHEPALPEYTNQDVIFFKQEGKFTVLFGHNKVGAAINDGKSIFKGRLISGPLLKRTRIDPPFDRDELIKKLQEPTPTFNAPRLAQDPRRSAQSYPRRGISNDSSARTTPPSAGERRYSSNETTARRDPKRS